jgi:hypothetical protein
VPALETLPFHPGGWTMDFPETWTMISGAFCFFLETHSIINSETRKRRKIIDFNFPCCSGASPSLFLS